MSAFALILILVDAGLIAMLWIEGRREEGENRRRWSSVAHSSL